MVLTVVVLLAACGGGGGGAAGTYVHEEEGTITLSDGGSATWEQEGQEPFEFEWSQEGDAVTFLRDGKEEGVARIEEGNLVIPPDMISGDEDVVFERQ